MYCTQPDNDPKIIAAARHSYDFSDNPVMVFANVLPHTYQGGTFALDAETKAWVTERQEKAAASRRTARFMVRNLFSKEPTKPVWTSQTGKPAPKTAQQLLEHGIDVYVDARATQALELYEVDRYGREIKSK